MIVLVRRNTDCARNVALAGALVLALAGCAPSTESPNPWAEFRQEPDPGPNSPPTAPPIEINIDDAPRFSLERQARHAEPCGAMRPPSENYPSPAPPAEERGVDANEKTLADKPPAPSDLDHDGATAGKVNPDVAAQWTGAVVYCQPGCVPCAMEIRDLRKASWKCGVGNSNHFKIVELLTLADFERRGVPSTPQTVYFVDGVEKPPRITGYGGTPAELAAIVNRHPKLRARKVGTAQSASPLWYDAPLLGAPVLAVNCGAPTMAAPTCASPTFALADCSSPTMSHSAPLTTVYEPAPIVTSVTYGDPVFSYPVYSAPLYRAAPSPGLTIGPATHSAQLSLFGYPLIGGSVGTTVNR
jgi:hypothetical protein